MPPSQTQSMIESAMSAKAAIQSAVSALTAQIMAKEVQRSQCRAEIAALRGQPVGFDDYMVYLRQCVEVRGANWFGSGNLLAARSHETRSNAKTWEELEPTLGEASSSPFLFPELHTPGERAHGGVAVFDAFCFFFPDQVMIRLEEKYRDTVAGRWGNEDLPSVQERRARVSDLASQGEHLDSEIANLRMQVRDLTAGLNVSHTNPEHASQR